MRRAIPISVACIALAACGAGSAVDERLVGTWQSSSVANNLTVTMRLTIDANGQYSTVFRSQLPLPNDSGTLTASSGEWRMQKVTGGVQEGTYEVLDANSVLFQASSGPVLWTRVSDAGNAASPSATSPPAEAAAPSASAPSPPPVLFNPGPDRPARAATPTAAQPTPRPRTAPREDLTDPQRRQEANMRAREEAARRAREAAQ